MKLLALALSALALAGCVETSRTSRLTASNSGLKAPSSGARRLSPGIHIDASPGHSLQPFGSHGRRFKPVDLPGVWEHDYASMKEAERLKAKQKARQDP